MLALVILAANEAGSGSVRIFLLLLLLLAIILVVAGGVIAGLTMYRTLKGQTPNANETSGE